jgi:serine/threonine protein kinase
MAMTIEQFRQQVVQAGLLTDAEVAACLQHCDPERRPNNVESLANELVRAGKLTKFQAAAIYQGKSKGLVLGDYLVLDKLGQGGMGMVLKAQHRRMKRLVAIKVLTTANKASVAIKRFYQEVVTAAQLNHPNIVTAYDSGEHEGILYLVMEYVDGKDLGTLIKQRGPMATKGALNCILQAARGLQYAHGKGVVHRDIKPGNLLLDSEGNVKILDMGLARSLIPTPGEMPNAQRLTQPGQVMGTGEYMAPEQAADPRNADYSADIYALGCTLYRLLTGRPPYVAETLVAMLMAHRDSPIPSLCDAVPSIPPTVNAIFQKMVAKRPQDRYQSMADVVADVEAFLAGRAPSVVRSAPSPIPSAFGRDPVACSVAARPSSPVAVAPVAAHGYTRIPNPSPLAEQPHSLSAQIDEAARAVAHQRAHRRWRVAVAGLAVLLVMIAGILFWEIARAS